MSDMVTVVDPGWTWLVWHWVGAVVGVVGLAALVCLLVSRMSSSRRSAESWFYAFKVIGIIALCLVPAGALASSAVSTSIRHNTIQDIKQEGMWDLGYHEIEFDDSDDYIFTAYKDGEYVKAVAIEVVPLSWQVIELVIPGVK